MSKNRICIYPKDIQRITGKSERYGRILIERIKSHFNKEEHQIISVEEYCDYTGLKMQDVKVHIID